MKQFTLADTIESIHEQLVANPHIVCGIVVYHILDHFDYVASFPNIPYVVTDIPYHIMRIHNDLCEPIYKERRVNGRLILKDWDIISWM